MDKKRLLVLGGTRSTLDVVKCAKSLGYEVIVTDNLQNGIAKEFADQCISISTADIDELSEYIFNHNISGVFTGASEFNTENMIKLCQRTNLPVYATEAQWQTCSNKARFKALCEQYDVSTVPGYVIDKDCLETHAKELKYPVIVKPVDSNSGVGISVCRDEQEFIHGYHAACSCSHSGKVIVERYMQCKNVEAYYIVQNGKVSLMSLSDRLTRDDQQGSPVPFAFFHPSVYTQQYIEKVNEKVCNMFEAFGLKQGVFFLESFYDGNDFYFYEMGYRLNGTMEYKFVDYFYDYNPLCFMIQYAVEGKFGDKNVTEEPYQIFNGYACELSPLLKKGVINKIEGLDEISNDKHVIFIHQLHDCGDEIGSTGTLQQNFARIHVVADTNDELTEAINRIIDILHIYDENGDEMLISYEQEEIRHHEKFKR